MTDETINETRSKFHPDGWTGGRKKLFPNEETSQVLITLPDHVLEYLRAQNKSLSMAIFDIVTRHKDPVTE